MISYNWTQQPLVLKLRDALNSAGYKIWIDVDHMSGSILEASKREKRKKEKKKERKKEDVRKEGPLILPLFQTNLKVSKEYLSSLVTELS